MKGKIKLAFKMLIMTIAVFAIGISLSLNTKQKSNMVASTLYVANNGESVSAKFGEDVVFSVEKVAVAEDKSFSSPLYVGGQFVHKFYQRVNNNQDVPYYFVDIANEGQNKYVVDNGEFVMLKNYDNENGTKAYDAEANGTQINLKQAIMISLGQYVYSSTTENNVTTEQFNIVTDTISSKTDPENAINAQITYLNIGIKVNGQSITLPGNRNVSINNGMPYFDFMYLLPYDDTTDEGYYQITINYMKNGVQYNENFEFYLLFESSYNGTIVNNETTYNAYPTLNWYGKSSGLEDDNYFHYFTGKDGLSSTSTSYPTLTYDYTKYKLSYTHTSANKTTKFDYSFVKTNSRGDMLITATGAEEFTKTEALTTYKSSNDKSSNDNNLVTLVLTEQGTYKFDFEYVYTLYNSSNVSSSNINLKIDSIYLAINGFELKYSKLNYTEAQLRYFEISNGNVNPSKGGLDIIVPNGYEKDDPNITNLRNNKLGLVYSIVESDEKAGNVLKAGTKDGLLHEDLSNELNAFKANNDDYSYLGFIKDINYVRTNQGSLWFNYNDKPLDVSFYLFSPNKIEYNSEKLSELKDIKQDYTAQTSFNQVGYYIVCIKLQPSGLNNKDYWQVFAFEYSTSTVNINTTTSSKVIDKNGYTNEDILVAWEKPGVFNKALKGYYVSILDNNATEQELENAYKLSKKLIDYNYEQPYTINAVETGHFAKYLIRVESEGNASTSKIITCDRQNISGVSGYAVKRNNYGGSIYYTLKSGSNGQPIKIENEITDSYVTLDWNNKNSGANITAKYSFTPIIKGSDANVWLNYAGETLLTNTYTLGSTSGMFDLTKSDSSYAIDYSNVLSNQGIYYFELVDDAGNKATYLIVIDKTPAYFQIDDGEFYTQDSKIYNTSIKYNVGDYKALKLNVNNDTLNEFIGYAASSSVEGLSNLNFADASTNAANLARLFKKIGDDYYLSVRNNRVSMYDGANYSYTTLQGFINPEANKASTVRSLYVVGENNIHDTGVYKTSSYLDIEINTDNSRTMVYYSELALTEENIPVDGGSSDTVFRLITDQDITMARATSAPYVAVTWQMGVGNYEISSVSFKHYELDLGTNTIYGDKYFYKLESETVLYDGGRTHGATITLGRGYYSFGNGSIIPDGLYVLNRVYVGEVEQGSNDQKSLSYYFIVDRNEIIARGIGGEIKINFLIDDTIYEPQQVVGAKTGSLEIDGTLKTFAINLTTGKLPMVMQVPVGKYFKGESATSAGYNAGKLNVRVMFIDINSQISQTNEQYEIYNSNTPGFEPKSEGGLYKIDLAGYLNYSGQASIIEKLVANSENATWLSLPGRYVVLIEDNVKDTNGSTHYNIFAIDIPTGVGPTTEIKTGFSNEEDVENILNDLHPTDNTYYVRTAEEYISITLPEYNKNNNKTAQVDVDYLLVRKYENGETVGSIYTEFDASHKQGEIDISSSGKYVQVDKYDNGNVKLRNVLLKTYLRDENGTIIVENLNKKLKYEVTIRYKLKNNGVNYENAYSHFVNGNRVYYYSTTYTIEIDRVAPTDNINYLLDNDDLVEIYKDTFNEQANTNKNMFEFGYHDSGAKIYFTNEYAAYYLEKSKGNTNLGLIYAFRVNASTPFNTSDLAGVRVVKIDNVENLNLALPVLADLDDVNLAFVSTYGGLLSQEGYYEIEEFDAAGNITQYVVHYSGKEFETLLIPITVQATSGGFKNISVGNANATISNGETLTVFGVQANENEQCEYSDNFFVIELKNLKADNTLKLTTSFVTDLSTLSSQLIKLINQAGIGQYSLTIKSRNILNDYVIYLNLLDSESIPELDVDKIIQKSNDKYYLVLDAANITVDDIYYYAKTISVTYNGVKFEYEYSLADGCYKLNGQKVENTILCQEGTYQVKVTNLVGKVYSPRRFNTVYGNIFDELTFGGEGAYYVSGDSYYGFTTATLKYNKNLFSADFTKLDNVVQIDTLDETYNYIIVTPKFENGVGEEIKVVVNLFDIEADEIYRTYNIIIDTTIPQVTLKDFQGISKSVVVEMNKNIEDVKTDKTATGILNLAWTPVESEHFNYTYTLHELIKDDEEHYVSTDLNNVTTKVISTTGNSLGSYRFEVKVYTLENVYLGNIVYAFEVQAKSKQAYYVRTASGEAIDANSSFKMAELKDDGLIPTSLSQDAITSSTQLFKLYVANEQLEVVLTDDEGTTLVSHSLSGNGFNFTICKIGVAEEYYIYIGLLTIEQTDVVINDFKVNNKVIQNRTTNDVFAGSSTDNVVVSGTQVSNKTKNILTAKNSLFVEIYYNASSEPFKIVEYTGNFSYEILGNGTYSFKIRDLAGNVQKFLTYSNGEFVDTFDLLVLREVVVLVNDKAPIDNAYYNKDVEVRLYGSTRYVTGSIRLTVTRNGETYTPTGSNPYIFSAPGTYRLVVTASYGEELQLTRSLLFTIINQNEAKTSIDLSNLNGYDIKVKDVNGVDVTEAFNEIINENSSQGMLLTYEKLVEYVEANPNKLALTAGKATFEFEYTVDDQIYPTRTERFVVTLNNETPTIDCSVTPGETTDKGFTITFNAGIIYDQIGDAKIYINDRLVAQIDEKSSRTTTSVNTTFNEFGAGDYYVRLETESGNVLTSFKVTIKEPLNFWAIIIIVAAVLVVGTVVTVIIVLRHKMRIR